MRAILIDPFTRTVSNIDTDASLDDMYSVLQVDLITVMQVGGGHAMILDDEGLLKDRDSQAYFTMRGLAQPLAGRAMILGDEYGESRAATLTIEEVEDKVVWLDNEKVEPEQWTGWTVTTW